MQARWTTTIVLAVAAAAVGWALHLSRPATEQTKPTDASEILGEAPATRDAPAGSPASADAPVNASERPNVVDIDARARFIERSREFFAQAPALSPEETRRRASDLSRELSRIEQAGGLSAGETFLLRAELIRSAVTDEQQRITQLRALKARYESDARERNARAAAQPDPMFELYKVREAQIVAETLSLQAIPNGLSRDEYLRRRLQAEREQLLGGSM